MKNNVLISLTSVQYQDDENSETELLTRAKLYNVNGRDIISYEDTSATGFEGSVTTITVEGSKSASINVREPQIQSSPSNWDANTTASTELLTEVCR